MRKTVQLRLATEWLARGQEPVAASRVGNMVFTSGVPGIDRKTGQLAEGPERQFAAAFGNLMELLQKAGAGPDSVGLLTVWIPDRTNRVHINKDWLRHYPGANRPARKTNQAPLPAGIEVQLMAARLYATSFSDLPAAEAAVKRALEANANNLPAFDLLARILQVRLRLVDLALVLGVLVASRLAGRLFGLAAQVVDLVADLVSGAHCAIPS